MQVSEFEDLIDRLGDDVSRWPDAQRLAAESLLATSPTAQVLLAESKLIREALTTKPVRAPAGLADRIVAAAAASKSAPEPADQQASVPSNSGKVLTSLLLACCLGSPLADLLFR